MILQLAMQCAPNVAPLTVAAIVATESRGEPYALNVNGGPRLGRIATAAAAVAVARRYVTAGYSVDLGLGQINSRNMRRLGLTWNTVFDPCTNLAALGRVLTESYEAALVGREPQAALRVAISRYNTGSPSRGFHNGYVGRVVAQAGIDDWPGIAPPYPISSDNDGSPATAAQVSEHATALAVSDAVPPAWDIFARAATPRRVALPSPTTRRLSIWSD